MKKQHIKFSPLNIGLFSMMCATLAGAPSFRIGLNALLSNDRVEPFQWDDEHFWFQASEYHRGKIGLVDYLLYPANGNIMVLPRLIFLVWTSTDSVETRFLFGILPGAIALALTTYLLILLLLELGLLPPKALGIALIFAFSLHSRYFFEGLAMNGLLLFQVPLMIWLLLRQVKNLQIDILTMFALSLLPVLAEGRQIVLILLIALVLSFSSPQAFAVRWRLFFATVGAAIVTIAMLLAARVFGEPVATFNQPDYSEYPSIDLLDGLWIGIRAHSLHVFWVWTNTRTNNFVAIGGGSPIPEYGTHLAVFLGVTSLVATLAIIVKQQVRRVSIMQPHLQVLAFCVISVSAVILATAIGRGASGWDWNAPRYSLFAGVIAVLILGVILQLSTRLSWRVLGGALLCLLIALQLAREWEGLWHADSANKKDEIATCFSLALIGCVFLYLLMEVIRDIESDILDAAHPPTDCIG